jgi:hypothetical protein
MRRLYLTNTTNAMNQRGQKADNSVVTNTAKILEQATRKKVGRVRGNMRIRTAGTGNRERS